MEWKSAQQFGFTPLFSMSCNANHHGSLHTVLIRESLCILHRSHCTCFIMKGWLVVLTAMLIATETSGFLHKIFAEGDTTGRYFLDGIFMNVLKYLQYGISALIDNKDNGRGKIRDREKITYSGYQVLRLMASNQEELNALREMPEEIDGIDFWTKPRIGDHFDLLVAPDSIPEVRDYLKKQSIDCDIMIHDLQNVISYENPRMNKSERVLLLDKKGHAMTWTRYHRFSDLVQYMEVLSTAHPNIVELITIGYSFEGLPLKVLKIGKRNGKKSNQEKPAVWIDGGMHGREWITTAVVLYLARELVERSRNYKNLVENLDWYLMPIANPDGYEYSMTADRLWKKNRSQVDNTESASSLLYSSCEGVDLNRNFDFQWGRKDASDDPCSPHYSGPAPFSEPESRAISNFVIDQKDKLKMFLTLHSYSQMWLIPWGYTANETSDHDDLRRVAKKAVDSMKGLVGNSYGIDRSSTYHGSGCSEDWAKGMAGIKYTYSVELRDRNHYGLLLPANQILPTSREIFKAVKSISEMLIAMNSEEH